MTSTLLSTSSQQNSTIKPESDQVDAWKTTTSPRITLLSFFILFGMVGNACIIITICHSRRFRTTAFYVFIINLTVVNMCECLLNMTILMSTSVSNVWSHGDIPCKMNAFFINLICIETLLSLTILTTDRMIAIKYREKYDHVISSARFSLLITFSWIQSLAFSLPIGIGSVPTVVYEYINYCTIATGSSIIYCVLLTLLCYIGPLAVCICFFIFIIKTWYKERFAVRALLAQSNYDENANEVPRIRREIQYSNLSATVCLSWLILEGPYVFTSIYKLFKTSSELETNENDNLEYTWYVDLVLLLLKFSYVLVLPIASFVWSKELRKELKDIVLCRKNNAVIDASIEKSQVEPQRLKNVREEEKTKEALSQQKEPRVFQIPVLFATSHGVHIKTVAKIKSDQSDKVNEDEVFGRKCDVAGSRDNLNVLEDDTSDYDSGNELDPFSVSHPISVKQLHDNLLTNKQRSNSQPEVRDRADKAKLCNTTVGSTSAGDSGLDLSTGYNSMSRVSIKDSDRQHLSVGEESIIESSNMELPNESIKSNEEHPNIIQSDKTGSSEANNKSQTNETTVSRIGEVVDTEIKPDNVLKTDPTLESETLNSNNDTSSSPHFKYNQQRSDDADANLPRRKKKKRREKHEDLRSITSDSTVSSPKLPLRPPPRLAPISAGVSSVKTQFGDFPRPDSSCSSQSSVLDNNIECVRSQRSARDHNTTSHSTLMANLYSESDAPYNCTSSVHSTLNYDTCDRTAARAMTLDCKMKSLPEEVLTPSDCRVTECLPVMDTIATRNNEGIDNPGFVLGNDDDHCRQTLLPLRKPQQTTPVFHQMMTD